MAIKLFADGAAMDGIIKAAENPRIVGFTTNPTLMRQAGVTDYEKFAKSAIAYLARSRPDTCLSLEVFADDFPTMLAQARKISDWGDEKDYKVYVKIPAVNTKGATTQNLVEQLNKEHIKVNVTAVFTPAQIKSFIECIHTNTPMIISIFAGRIADAGVDPVSIIQIAREYWDAYPVQGLVEFLWASPREVYNYIQAEQCGCDIITMTPELIAKMKNFGKDLTEYSRETVEMFYKDAVCSGFSI